METIWLESFIALSEHHSMRAAANELCISTSTLSDRISSLEDSLGTKLIQRTAQGCLLTEQGKVYLNDAKNLLEDWHGIVSSVRKIKHETFCGLRLAFQGDSLVPVVGSFLDDFMSRHPDVELSLVDDYEVGIADGLGKDTVDLYFAYEPSEIALLGMVHRPVFRTRLCVIVSPNHPYARKGSVSLKELDGETLIIYPKTKETSLRDFELNMLRSAGIHFYLYEGNLSSRYYHNIVQMGCGIAIYPHLSIRHIPPKTSLLEISDSSCCCDIEMIYNPENSNPVLQMFLEEFGDTRGEDAQ
ncbi:MAG: LysR family transcriptional regulator [Lachnospiraceae bacterium]|jgi:DNA-binding transcriptional LysR family regulator